MEAKLDILVVSGVSGGDIFHFDLTTDQNIRIGRLPESEIVLQDPTVSREHAKIFLKPDGFYLCDAQSSQGTILMGFRLEPGEDHAQRLENGAEFKIGDTIFRASFDVRLFPRGKKDLQSQATLEGGVEDHYQKVIPQLSIVPKTRRSKILVILSLLLAILVGVYFTLDNTKVRERNLSDEKITFPQGEAIEKITGYFKQGNSSKEKDFNHKHQAKFTLPAADVVIEYQIKSEVPVSVLLDNQLLERIDVGLNSWEYRQVIVKDVPASGDRYLIFKPEKSPNEAKKWALKDIRATPIRVDVNTSTKAELTKVISLCDVFDKNPTSLFDILRAAQSLVLTANNELGRDIIGFSVNLNQPLPEIKQIRDQLSAVNRERKTEVGVERLEKHLELYTQIVSAFDAELWRRINNRTMRAHFAARKKRHVEAYDALLGGKEMFSVEGDYRVILLDQMLNDKKVIPKKLLKNPDKYRKKNK